MIRLVWKFSYTHSIAHSTSSLFVFGFLLHRSIFPSTSCNLNECKTVWKHFSQIIFKEMISIINSVHWTVMQKRFYVSRAAIASNKAKPCWTLSPWKYLYVLSFIQLSTLIIFQMNWICFRETFDAFNFGLFLSAKMRKYSSRNPLKRIRYQVSIIRFPPSCSARHGNSKCSDQNPINKMKSPFCHLPKRRKCEKMKMKLINGDFISNDNQHKNTIKRGDMPKSSDHYQCCWCLFLSFSRSKITIRCCCIEFRTLISSVASFCIL